MPQSTANMSGYESRSRLPADARCVPDCPFSHGEGSNPASRTDAMGGVIYLVFLG